MRVSTHPLIYFLFMQLLLYVQKVIFKFQAYENFFVRSFCIIQEQLLFTLMWRTSRKVQTLNGS